MSILTNNPTDITTGTMWNVLVRGAQGKEIYKVLDYIAHDCETLGVKMAEGKPARSQYCYLAVGKDRGNGHRICELQLQAPNADNTSGWTPYQSISLEMRDYHYQFRYDTHFKPAVKNDVASRAFTDIYKIPRELFNDLRDAINR